MRIRFRVSFKWVLYELGGGGFGLGFSPPETEPKANPGSRDRTRPPCDQNRAVWLGSSRLGSDSVYPVFSYSPNLY